MSGPISLASAPRNIILDANNDTSSYAIRIEDKCTRFLNPKRRPLTLTDFVMLLIGESNGRYGISYSSHSTQTTETSRKPYERFIIHRRRTNSRKNNTNFGQFLVGLNELVFNERD